jgi:uncharacterized protein DUF5676
MAEQLNIRKFGLATGLTGVLLYFGCILLMLTVGRDGTIQFFNSLFHGLDMTPIIRVEVPLWEALLGIVEIFVLGWLSGACVAGIYNFSMTKSSKARNTPG